MRFRFAASLAFLAATSGASFAAELTGPLYRAVIADHANGKITMIDPVKGTDVAHFGIAGPARLRSARQGRYVYLTQGNLGLVNVLDSGIEITGHGDHLDIDIEAPELLSVAFKGPKPSHVNFGKGKVVVFFDGEGGARFVDEERFTDGKGKISNLKTPAPHHGLAKPVGDLFAVSIPNLAEPKALPIGIDLVTGACISQQKSTACPDMHGEGGTSGVTAFGCGDGVLFIKENKGSLAFEKLSYPAKLPADRKVRTIEAAATLRVMVGDFGADGMVVIDPEAKDFTFVQLPSRRMAFAMDSHNGDATFIITEDGQVHKMLSLTGRIEKSAQITARYSMDGGSAVARPRLSANGKVLVVTDPAMSQVLVLDTATLAITAKVPVAGAPFDVLLIGGINDGH